MADQLVQGLRLIGSGHYHGLGEAWLKITGDQAADEIERLRAKLDRRELTRKIDDLLAELHAEKEARAALSGNREGEKR